MADKEEEKKEFVKNLKAGDIIKLGSWPVGIEGEVAEAIEWEILEKNEDGTAIVLSSKVIDAKPYNSVLKGITWAKSSLRKWLNGEFYIKAFAAKEKDAIVETRLVNADNIGEFTHVYADLVRKWDTGSSLIGDEWHTQGGEDTTDKVWLLSLEDMKRYSNRFSTNASRIAKPIAHIAGMYSYTFFGRWKDNGVEGNAWWWLRSPGHYQHDVARVYCDGFIRDYGFHADNKHGGVRPALKINLNNL